MLNNSIDILLLPGHAMNCNHAAAAMEQIERIFIDTLKQEALTFKTEIDDLKARVQELEVALAVKDQHCRRIAAVLQTKNEEWKRIKLKLQVSKRRTSDSADFLESTVNANDTPSSGATMHNTASEDIIDKNNTASQYMIDKNYSTATTHKTTEDIHIHNTNDCYLDEESTQLPPAKSHNQPDASLSPQPPQSQTQSPYLDALIDLISDHSDSEKENAVKEQEQKKKFSTTFMDQSKRKSHARGCECCDKYYLATRSGSPKSSNISSDSSFIVGPNTPPGFWDTSFTPRQ